MRKIISIALVAVMAVFFVACTSATTPFATNVPVAQQEAKYGESVCRWVFGFQSSGCSVDEAIKKAGIKQVQTINYHFFQFAPFYNSQTIGVRGK